MIVFPKEQAILYNKIVKSLECEDFDVVYKFKKELMEGFEYYKTTNIYIGLIKALFYKERFQDVIILTEELSKKGYEKYDIFFYLVFSTIALNDIMVAYTILSKYKIMNDPEIKILWNKDESIYSSSNVYSIDIQKAVISARFVIELIKEYHFGVDNEDGYLGLRVYELINSLLEIGYNYSIVKELTDIANLIFIAYNI